MKFLGENIDKFNHKTSKKLIEDSGEIHNYDLDDMHYFNITDGEIYYRESNLEGEWRGLLEDLESASIFYDKMSECEHLMLAFTNNSIEVYYSSNDKTYYRDFVRIQFSTDITYIEEGEDTRTVCNKFKWSSEDEFVQRMLKALKHLAFLANEKRSKSKF